MKHCQDLSKTLIHDFDRPQLNRFGEILADLPKRLGLLPDTAADKAGRALIGELKAMHGGAYVEEDLERIWGPSTSQNMDRRRNHAEVVWWSDVGGKPHYPKWQFGEKGEVLSIVEKLLRVLRSRDVGHILSFFLLPADRLNGKSVVELMGDAANHEILLEHARRGSVWENF